MYVQTYAAYLSQHVCRCIYIHTYIPETLYAYIGLSLNTKADTVLPSTTLRRCGSKGDLCHLAGANFWLLGLKLFREKFPNLSIPHHLNEMNSVCISY